MGLWLKCPACQTKNPLDHKSCTSCGASLENLPPAKRVYILEKGTSSPEAMLPSLPPKTSGETRPVVVAAPEAPEAPPRGKKGTKAPKKKKG
jgi:hypothetical protein